MATVDARIFRHGSMVMRSNRTLLWQRSCGTVVRFLCSYREGQGGEGLRQLTVLACTWPILGRGSAVGGDARPFPALVSAG
jgi:hypothetical protein